MNVMDVCCSNCAGTGTEINWKIVNMDEDVGTAVKEEIVCRACDGKGYKEYATFTLEEATAILKHCGLSTDT